MKKITLLILLFIAFASKSYGQIIATENFDSALDWTVAHPVGTNTNIGWTQAATGTYPTCSPFAGAGMARFNSFSVTAGDSYELTSPAIVFTGGAYRVSFKMYRDNGYPTSSDIIDVYFNTTATSAGGTLLGSVNRAIGLTPIESANGWYSYTFLIPGNPIGSGFISLLATSAYGNNIFVDEIKVENVPTCDNPTALTTSNITSSGATIAWTSPTVSPSNGYEYYYSTTNVTPTVAALGSTASGVTSATISGLLPATTYYFWTRSICSLTDTSTWSDSKSFITACVSVTSFSENFDGVATSTFPTCWGKVGTIGSAYLQTTNSSSAPNTLYMYGSGVMPVVKTIQVSNLGAGTNRLKFDMRANFTVGGIIEIGYLTDPNDSTTFIALGSVTASLLTYSQYVFTPVSGVYSEYLAFRHTGTPANSVLIDNAVWEAIPTCVEPTLLVVPSLTSSTAMVSWTAPTPAPANGYEYFLSTTNTAPNATTVATGSVSAGMTMVDLANLTPATTYYVWVRGICGASDSSAWSNSRSFITACVAITTLPWAENFDTLITGTNIFPSCWAYENTSSTWSISTSPVAYSGVNSLRRTWSTDGWAYTPLATLNAGTSYTLSYYMRTNDAVVGYDLTVGVGNGQTAAAMTTTLSTVAGYQNPTWTKFTFEFTPTLTGDYSYGVHVVAPLAPNGINFDDFKLEVTPSCLEPTLLVVSSITSSAAMVSWTASTSNPANGYEYFVSTSNTAPNATTVATGSVSAGMTMANLATLTSATTYYVWVRSICSGSVSAWSAGIPFTTVCVATTIPYTQNFETTTVPALPRCTSNENAGNGNNWTTAASPGFGFTSNVMKYTYNFSSAANAWFFTQPITLTAGITYSIGYNYGNNSTTYVESLKVAYGTNANSASMTNLLADYPSVTGSVLLSDSISFTPTASGDYNFGFNAYSTANQDYLFVDDIAITVSLATPTFNSSSFSYYPNPVKNTLNLSYSENISDVSVYNLLGQQVIAKAVNTNQSQIDMSHLTSGTYMVKVTANNQVKTIKVIKE